jgi:hypothetical protein
MLCSSSFFLFSEFHGSGAGGAAGGVGVAGETEVGDDVVDESGVMIAV